MLGWGERGFSLCPEFWGLVNGKSIKSKQINQLSLLRLTSSLSVPPFFFTIVFNQPFFLFVSSLFVLTLPLSLLFLSFLVLSLLLPFSITPPLVVVTHSLSPSLTPKFTPLAITSSFSQTYSYLHFYFCLHSLTICILLFLSGQHTPPNSNTPPSSSPLPTTTHNTYIYLHDDTLQAGRSRSKCPSIQPGWTSFSGHHFCAIVVSYFVFMNNAS